ncbi:MULTISPECIES: hypothetical protein [Brevibacterium]
MSGPSGQYGQGQYGSAPGGQYGQGQYGSGPAQQYGSGPGQQYGSGPGQYGSGPGPYGSGQFGPGGPVPQRPRRTGPGLLGPLTLRDLFLLFAGLLALIVLFVPYKTYDIISIPLWAWNIDSMGTFVFIVLTILLIVAAVLVNKLGSGSMRVGSLGLDQFISVLASIAFAYAFVQLVTSVPYWSVGAYLAFFAALIAFFAGVFTMLPFFAGEFANRAEVPAHAKARPVTKSAQHPAPQANVPGGFGDASMQSGHPGSQGQFGQGQPGQGQFGQGQPGPGQSQGSGQGQFGSAQFGAPQGGFGQSDQGQPGFGGSAETQAPYAGGQPNLNSGDAGQQQSGYAPEQSGYAPQNAPAEQSGAGRHSYPATEANTYDGAGARPDASFAPPAEDRSSGMDDASGQSVQSTGSGQTYLGDQHPRDPKHSQSEPTQTFGLGTEQWQSEESAPTDSDVAPSSTEAAGAPAAPSAPESSRAPESREADSAQTQGGGRHSAPAPADGQPFDRTRSGEDSDAPGDTRSTEDSRSGDDTRSADDTVAISKTVVDGASVTEGETIISVSERRRGRHAAPDTPANDTSSDSSSSDGTSRADAVSSGDPRPDVRSGSGSSSDSGMVASSTVTSADEPGPGPLGIFEGGTKSATTDDESASASSESGSDRDSTADSAPTDRDSVAAADTISAADTSPTAETSSDSADSRDRDWAASTAADGARESNIRSTEATVVTADGVIDDDPGADPTGTDTAAAESRREDSDRSAAVNENGASENSVSEETVKVEAVGSPENGEETTERTTPPDSDEPTQYVPMANYRDSSERGDSSDQARTGGADGQRSDSADSPETSEEKAVIQAFWFAVPEPREAVDAKTGMPVFTIYPGDWFLALEDKGSSFTVRDSDGKEGVLRNLDGIQRG